MGILFYGPGICNSSHLWMRRNYESLAGFIELIIEEEEPACLSVHKKLVILPVRKHHASRIKRFFSDILTDIRCQKIVSKEIKNPSIDKLVIHFLTNAVRYRKIFQKNKLPVYVHCHGIDVTWQLYSIERKWRKLWWGKYVKQVQRLSDNVCFIANSANTKNKLIEINIHPDRVFINSPGVPIPPKTVKRDPGKKELQFLFLGRLMDVKGPEQTILAFIKACDMGLKGNLILAGDGNLRKACESIADESKYPDRIKILGKVSPEEGELLRAQSDIFTAHSQKGPVSLQEEAFGVAFVEAMAAGLPVVTGASGSIPEIVRNRIDGLLFEPGDIDGHANALIELAENPEIRITMGIAAASRAKENYSLEKEKIGLKRILELKE